MRVIGGEWRGQRLEEPRGADVTRPTTDRTREACASMLDSAREEGIPGARVLDAFAGSGAMGIELLSRGAAHATFYDLDRAAAALVRRNLEHVRCAPERFQVVCGDILSAAGRRKVRGGPFDIVLMDPPYRLGAVPAVELLDALARTGQLAPGALALFERASATPPLDVAGFDRLREKRYGTTAVDLLAWRGAADGEARLDPTANMELL